MPRIGRVDVRARRNAERFAKAVAAVAQLRERRGLLSQIARKLGVRRQATSRWTVVPEAHLIAVADISGLSAFRLRPDLPRKRIKALAQFHYALNGSQVRTKTACNNGESGQMST